MDDRQMRRRVGVVAVATFVIAALLVAATSRLQVPFFQAQYPVQIQTTRAPGVGPNTPVRRDGVLIGRVEKTESVRGGVMITAQINADEVVLTSDMCRIRPSSLFGDAVIDFMQAGDMDAPGQPLPEGGVVEGAALPDPIEAITSLQVDVGPAVQSLGQAADAVSQLANRLNRVIGEDASSDKFANLIDKASLAVDDFSASMNQLSQAAASIDRLVGDQQTQQQLRQAITDAPKLVTDLRDTIQQASQTIDSLSGAVGSAEQNLRNLEGLTEPLGAQGAELSQLIVSAIENLDLVLADARQFSKALGASEGSLGLLVSDPQLYNNVNTVVCNVNTVLHKINKLANQLEPVLHDARVFSDKIAREPGRLVGGALNRGPGVK